MSQRSIKIIFQNIILPLNGHPTCRFIYLWSKGYIPVYYFLVVVLYGNKEYPGPYKKIEKGLILLYHIVSGNPGKDMHELIPYTTFYNLYKKPWITNYTDLNKIVKKT